MPFKDPPKPNTIKIIPLQKGQFSPMPGTPKWVLVGPGELEVTHYPDGRISGRVLKGDIKKSEVAIHEKLQRIGW